MRQEIRDKVSTWVFKTFCESFFIKWKSLMFFIPNNLLTIARLYCCLLRYWVGLRRHHKLIKQWRKGPTKTAILQHRTRVRFLFIAMSESKRQERPRRKQQENELFAQFSTAIIKKNISEYFNTAHTDKEWDPGKLKLISAAFALWEFAERKRERELLEFSAVSHAMQSENSRDCFSFYPEFTNALAIQPHPTHNVSHSTERWMEHSRQTWVLPSSWDVNTIVFLMESGEKERRVMKNSFPVSANWQENFNIKHMNACFVDCKHKLLFLWWIFFHSTAHM